MRRHAHVVGAVLFCFLSLLLVKFVKFGFYVDVKLVYLIVYDVGIAEFCILIVGGQIGGQLPDIIERPKYPSHRGVFHSKIMLFIMLVGYGVLVFIGVDTSNIRLFGFFILTGYISHLMMDSTTSRGLK